MTDTPPTIDVLIPTTGRPSLWQALLAAVAQTYPMTRVVVASDKDHCAARRIFDGINTMRGDMGHAATTFVTTPEPFGCGDGVKEWWINHADSAPFIRFLDDDDWMPPTAIADMARHIVNRPNVVLVVCQTVLLLARNGLAQEWRIRPPNLKRGGVVANCALFRKSAAQGVKLRSDPASPRFWLHDIAAHGETVACRLPLYWYNASRKEKPNPMEG